MSLKYEPSSEQVKGLLDKAFATLNALSNLY